MGFASITGHIEALPEDVFGYVTATDRLPEWCTLITEVRGLADRLDHAGAKFDGTLHIAGRGIATTWEVTRVRAPFGVRLVGSAQDGYGTFWFSASRWDGGTEVTLEVEYELPGGIVQHAADRLFLERTVARELRHSVANLSAILADEPARHR